MHLGDDYSQIPKPKENFERIFLAIRAAACIFAFQNCSFDKTKISAKSLSAPKFTKAELRVDLNKTAR